MSYHLDTKLTLLFQFYPWLIIYFSFEPLLCSLHTHPQQVIPTWQPVWGDPSQPCPHLMSHIKWERFGEKCYGCKQHFLPATPPDDHYILVRPEADWYWEKQNMQWRLGRKSNRYYHMSPHCIRRNFPRFSFAHVVVPAELPKPIKDILQYRFTQSCWVMARPSRSDVYKCSSIKQN